MILEEVANYLEVNLKIRNILESSQSEITMEFEISPRSPYGMFQTEKASHLYATGLAIIVGGLYYILYRLTHDFFFLFLFGCVVCGIAYEVAILLKIGIEKIPKSPKIWKKLLCESEKE